jgi:hypothetical protein
MIANLFLFIVFELASGFCNSLGPFLAVRALYGVCMGVRISKEIHTLANADYNRVYSVPLLQLRSKIYLMMHVVSLLACFSKVTLLATFWRQFSIAHLSQLQAMDGEVSSGLARDLPFYSSPGDYIFRRPITFR